MAGHAEPTPQPFRLPMSLRRLVPLALLLASCTTPRLWREATYVHAGDRAPFSGWLLERRSDLDGIDTRANVAYFRFRCYDCAEEEEQER